jgi:CRISPR/Cas system endoribonuclease Cas6 (RAMP superfamily)
MKEGTDCKHIKELLSRLDEEEVKNMVQKKKRPQKNQIRTWPPAYDDIGSLALQIFKDYPEEHKKIGINRPSRKVAIDYMRVKTCLNTAYKMVPQNEKNNYFLKIVIDGGIN